MRSDKQQLCNHFRQKVFMILRSAREIIALLGTDARFGQQVIALTRLQVI